MIQINLPYWIHDNYFIFKPHFNGLITDYLDIIIKYNKLIFSDYNELEDIVQIITDNKNFNPYNHIGSGFNQLLTNSLDKLINLTQIIFGENFNQPLEKSLVQLTNLTHITFGYHFNQPLQESLYYLTKLEFLKLGHEFNQELYLPPNIKILALDCNNQNLIDSLPNSIEQLNLDINFNLPLDNLPSSIKKISFDKDSDYNISLTNLPKSLKQLELPEYYRLI